MTSPPARGYSSGEGAPVLVPPGHWRSGSLGGYGHALALAPRGGPGWSAGGRDGAADGPDAASGWPWRLSRWRRLSGWWRLPRRRRPDGPQCHLRPPVAGPRLLPSLRHPHDARL